MRYHSNIQAEMVHKIHTSSSLKGLQIVRKQKCPKLIWKLSWQVPDTIWDQIWRGLQWYCNNTSLHGFHFITHKNSSIFTRTFFALVSCCSVVLCTYLIMLQVLEHEQRSIITTITSTAYPIWKVRFPAITVCNFNIVYKDRIRDVLGEVKRFGVNETIFLDLVYNLSKLISYSELGDMAEYEGVYKVLEEHHYDTTTMMSKLSQPCEKMLSKCLWQTNEVECSKLFRTSKTTQGYCCSFNYFGTRKQLPFRNSTNIHYQYVGGAGPTLGLRLFLNVDEEQYVSSIRPTYGFNVLVQDGIDYPDMNLISNTLLKAEGLTISVTPKIYVSSKSIRDLDLEDRHCMFENEGNLKWSSIYSYKTCVSECKARAMLQMCGCVPFFYPRYTGLDSQRVCTLMDVPCLRQNRNKYNTVGLSESFLSEEEFMILQERIGNVIECNCYPLCNEQRFHLHTDRIKAIPMIGYSHTNMSLLQVYFNTDGCIKTERDVYYTWDRVLASIGGIIGLCLGGSVISILECFFFLGKCSPDCNKIKAKPVRSVQPPHFYYANDFAHHRHGVNYIKDRQLQFKEKSVPHGVKNSFHN